ncbi:unnamed protein product [Symbiodinium sp. CCMP2456]|nr:unnamed protein product [Symbiodinium sp. CCMP2456]
MEESSSRPRALCCIWGELRGILVTLENLLGQVLEPMGADLLVVAQRALEDDQQRCQALRDSLGDRLLSAELYDKPDPEIFFGDGNFEDMSKIRGNWINAGNTQVLINHKIIADQLSSKGLVDLYDLFMFTRSDFMHLIPFPPAGDLLRCVGRGDVLTQAGHEFGGVNYNLAIARADTALRYLLAPYETIVSRSLPNRQKTYNIELFWRVIFGQKSLRNLRMPITCFVTAESTDDRTSWRKIQYSEEHQVLFKYEVQMGEAFSNQSAWNRRPEWTILRPPLGLQVTEAHGQARRLFGLQLAEKVPERAAQAATGSKREAAGRKKAGAAGAEPLQIPTQEEAVEEDVEDADVEKDGPADAEVASEEVVRFHGAPRKGWDRYFRGMHCNARNVITWKGRGTLPEPPKTGPSCSGCWLLPTSDEAAVAVAQQQDALRNMGWRIVTSEVEVLRDLGNKVRLQDFAKAYGLSGYLPRRFDSPASASYPCILKQAFGEFGKECRIVHSPEEAQQVAPHGLGTRWVMQELIRGRFEVSTTVLVDSGQILDEISSCYEYDSDTYVWPRCRRVSKHLHSVPEEHMLVFQEFLRQYRGICNFNYKVRESGQLSIFELNTRIGGDLAVDAPRDRARALLEKLDEHFNSMPKYGFDPSKILELDTNECVQNYENEFLGPATTESAFSVPLLHLLLAREMSMAQRAACGMSSRLGAFL